jgi:hypothetical protein
MDTDREEKGGQLFAWVTAPIVALILANLLPVGGVLFFGWNVFQIVFLFWLENVMTGILTLLKMLVADPTSIRMWFNKIIKIPLFFFEYGMFTFVHGILVLALTLVDNRTVTGDNRTVTGDNWIPDALKTVMDPQLPWVAGILLSSHAFSFIWNYIGKGEYRNASLENLMTGSFNRVVVLHLTVLFGGSLMVLYKAPVAFLLPLVAIKIILDIRGHIRERKSFGLRNIPEAVLGES